jgi:hypothetical protein
VVDQLANSLTFHRTPFHRGSCWSRHVGWRGRGQPGR